MALYPVILAGGSGTRLWPLSREHYPKPFLTLGGERSLFQEAVCRLDGIDEASSPVIVCNEEHRFLLAEHCRQLGKRPLSIILEPVGRNTAPALTLAALALANLRRGSNGDDDPVMLVMPADHVIRDVAAFQSAVRSGVALAEGNRLVTLGIALTGAETRYGYIKKGQALEIDRAVRPGNTSSPSFRVDGFVEKPDDAMAETMLKSRDYLWNSGIFIMRVSLWMEQIERYRPDIAEACGAAYSEGERDGDFYRPGVDLFTACPSDTIDYAVMERVTGPARPDRTPECAVVPLDAGWSDVGTWTALWEEGDREDDGNLIRGDVYARSVRNSLLISQHRLLAAVGLDDIVAVETADAVLVAHKDHVQEVRALVEQLKLEDRAEQENHRKVHRPWGSYETVDAGPRFQVKRLTVNPGASLSLQMHHHRAEHWVVVTGTAKVTRGEEELTLGENESMDVPVGTTHRLENPGRTPLEIIEVQSGSYLGEDDIVRLDDRYNRHKPNRKQEE